MTTDHQDVHKIGLVPIEKQASDDTVKLLKRYLADAEAGKIEALFVVALTPDYRPQWDWSSLPSTNYMVGAIERAKAVLMHEVDQED